MSGRIAIVSGSSLCRNPRVLKEATSLATAGHVVDVLGAWLEPRLKAEDLKLLADAKFRFTPVVDCTDLGIRDRCRYFTFRALTKCARWAYRRSRIASRWQLGLVVGALSRAAERRSFDLAIAHSEPALWVLAHLRRRGRRVGVDFEDWFSEDLLPEARVSRPVGLLRNLERDLLKEEAHATCTSEVMGRALAEAYGSAPPAVVYNAFPWSDRLSMDGLSRDREGKERPSIHWYSQTLGKGRGLEDLIQALPMLRTKVDVHLRGRSSEGFVDWLRGALPDEWRERLFVHDLVPTSELLSRISEHDLGFAGEVPYCRNRDLTVTNKILHYLLGGLAVVASDTAGQLEIAAQAPMAVSIYPSGNAAALAQRMDSLLASKSALGAAKDAALAAAERLFSWERQEGRLLSAVQGALESREIPGPGSRGVRP